MKARFPHAVWYLYSNYPGVTAQHDATLSYIESLTPGLSREEAEEFLNQLIADHKESVDGE